MKEQIIAKRYAQAYVSYARSAVGVPGIVDEFKGLKQIIQDNPGLREFFENPGITDSEKYQFIDSVFVKGFSEEFRVFLKLLIEKVRIVLLPEIIDFIRINYAYGEAVEAVLETAYPLDLDLVSRIERALAYGEVVCTEIRSWASIKRTKSVSHRRQVQRCTPCSEATGRQCLWKSRRTFYLQAVQY